MRRGGALPGRAARRVALVPDAEDWPGHESALQRCCACARRAASDTSRLLPARLAYRPCVRMAWLYSFTARSRWPDTSKMLPSLMCAHTSVHFGSRSPLSASRIFVGGGLVVVLQEENLGHAIVRQRAVSDSPRCAFWYSFSASPNSPIATNCSPRLMATATRMAGLQRSTRAVGIDGHGLRLAERVDGELRRRAHHVHALGLRIAFGLDLESPPASGTCPDPARSCPSRGSPFACGTRCTPS